LIERSGPLALKVSLKRKGEDLEVFFLFLSLFFPLFLSRR
jgi:hypothetical protein